MRGEAGKSGGMSVMKAVPQPEMMRLVLGKIKTKGYVGAKEIEGIASRLRIPSSSVYGFVSQFAELPQRPSRARVRVCTGPACAAAGAWAIYEDLKSRAPGGVEVLAEPGMLRWHASPAVSVDLPGRETMVAEGLGPHDIDNLVSSLEMDGSLTYGLARDAMPPFPQTLPGNKPSPWSAAMRSGSLPETWGPELLAWAGEHRGEASERIAGALCSESVAANVARAGIMVCDLAGSQAENSVNFAASMLHPRAVVAGGALAAVACGVRKLVFYHPWNEASAAEALEDAAAELLPGVGIKYSVFRGPANIPCGRDIGRAAVLRGMMLWQAAALYKWGGTRGADSPLLFLDAEEALRVPWLITEDKARGEAWADMRLLSLCATSGAPMLLEAPLGMSYADMFEKKLGSEVTGGDLKAVYSVAREKAVVVPGRQGGGTLEVAGEAVPLDPMICMPLWAQYLAWNAERDCCGGCVPGRTAPAAAARLLLGILLGEADEEVLETLESLMASAGGLALCPRLQETFSPILACLREFREEFEQHALRGTCTAGSCMPAASVAR
jgi:hypothetical protein